MLSDADSKQHRKSKRDRSIGAATNKQWSDNQKMEAVQSYLALGNLALTSRILGIPEITLRVWKRSTWWNDLINEVKTQERIEVSAKMKKLIGASLVVVEDRLINGDYQYDQKTGDMIRKPVALKDAHKVAMDMQTRQDVLDKIQDTSPTDESNVESKLLKLAEKFADMATKKIGQKQLESQTIDVEDITPIEEQE